jgi:hypothetical protein
VTAAVPDGGGGEVDKKLYFCGKAGIDNPGAWAKMMSEEDARGMVSPCLERAGWPEGKPISRFRVEVHPGGDGDTRVHVWGEEEPGFQGDDYGLHEGIKVEVDGAVVYNDLKPSEESEPGDHEDCEDCAKDGGPGVR